MHLKPKVMMPSGLVKTALKGATTPENWKKFVFELKGTCRNAIDRRNCERMLAVIELAEKHNVEYINAGVHRIGGSHDKYIEFEMNFLNPDDEFNFNQGLKDIG